MNGYTTIGITPDIQAHLDREDWSEPVRVRAHRGANGALELEFESVGTGAPVYVVPDDLKPSEEIRLGRAKVRAAQRATDQ